MVWGNNGQDNNSGPWGKPSGNRPTGGGGNTPSGGGGNRPPGGPDWDKIFHQGQDRFRKIYNEKSGNSRGIMLLCTLAVIVWLASGLYIVRSEEQGVVVRFGKSHHTDTPGLRYHWPYPIETALTPRVTAINKVEIGNRQAAVRVRGAADVDERQMLSGDENIIDVSFEVQWRIRDASEYLFNIRDPEEAIRDVAQSAMREVVGKMPIMTIISEEAGKQRVQADTERLMQDTLDNYKAGVEIVSVNLLDADPPAQVIDSFRDVQSARADLEAARNQAEAYRNDIIPRARGDAQKIVLDAEAYQQEVVARANGEAERFKSVYEQYKLARDVTRKRMYLEMMEDILHGMNKVIVDGRGAQAVLPYMPLPGITPKAVEEKKP